MYVPYTYMYIRYKCNNNIFLLSDNIKRKTQKKNCIPSYINVCVTGIFYGIMYVVYVILCM